MTRHFYSADSLSRVLESLERRYEMSSESFYAALTAGEPLEAISGFDRHVWASFYRDVRRLRGDDFADEAELTLALA